MTADLPNLEPKRSRPETLLAATWTLLVRIATTALLAYVLYRVRFVIVVVLVAVMLAFTMAPIVEWLMRSPVMRPFPRDVRRSAATSIVFAVVAVLLVELGIWTLKPITTEIHNLIANWSSYQAQWSEKVRNLQEQYAALPPDIRDWVEKHGFQDMGGGFGQRAQEIVGRTFASGMILVDLVLIPVLAFSFLTESRPLKREFAMLLPAARIRDGLYVARQVGLILQSYAIGQMILALIAGAFTWALLVSFGVHYPLAMAGVAAITRVIPVIGPVIGAMPIVLLASLQGWDRGVAVLIAFSLMHLVESKVIMPRVIGYRIKLHPAVVIVALLIGAEFFGMWGMFLAAPVAAVVKTLVHYFLVRPRIGRRRPPLAPRAPMNREEERVERAAVAGVRSHSGAH